MGFALTWQSVGGIVLMLLVVVALHEFGHFVIAKWSGIMVLEYSIGFGPALLRRTYGETQYSLRLLPLGGYVRMAGMAGTEAPGQDGGARGFLRASPWRRAATLAAGGIMNMLLAAALFTGIAIVGGPAPGIEPAGALAQAGVPNGWQIVGVRGSSTTSLVQIRSLIQSDRGRPMEVSLKRWNSQSRRSVVVRPQLAWIGTAKGVHIPLEAQITAIDGRSVAGMLPTQILHDFSGSAPLRVLYHTSKGVSRSASVPRSAFAAEWLVGYYSSEGNPLVPGLGGPPQPWYQAAGTGVYTVPSQIGSTFVNLWTLVAVPHHNPALRLSGPIGIAEETSIATQISPSVYLTLMGLISVNLGLLNLLPIPFLDGGRLFFVLLEMARRRRVSPRLEAAVHAVGLALIAMLFIYVTYGDLTHLSG